MRSAAKAKQAEILSGQQRVLRERAERAQRQRLAAASAKKAAREKMAEAQASVKIIFCFCFSSFVDTLL